MHLLDSFQGDVLSTRNSSTRQDALSNNLKKPIGYVIERATIKKGVGDLLDVFVGKRLPWRTTEDFVTS